MCEKRIPKRGASSTFAPIGRKCSYHWPFLIDIHRPQTAQHKCILELPQATFSCHQDIKAQDDTATRLSGLKSHSSRFAISASSLNAERNIQALGKDEFTWVLQKQTQFYL